MDSSVSPKDEIWFLRVCHHISNAVYNVTAYTLRHTGSALTPWSRVLLERLTGFRLVKKFPAIYVTRRFITAVTSARHLSLSWASSIQPTHPHSTSWRSILPNLTSLFSVLRLRQSIIPGSRFTLWLFRNMLSFYGQELLAPRSTPKLEDGLRSTLFNETNK